MRRRVAAGLVLLDSASIVAGLGLAWVIWLYRSPNLQRMLPVSFAELWLPNPWMPAGLVCLMAWLYAIYRVGLYDTGKMENSVVIVSALWKTTVFMAAFVMVINFFVAERVYPRSLVLSFVGASSVLLISARLAIFRLILRLATPITAVSALIVGTGADSAEMAERVERMARHVCRVRGHVRAAPGEASIVEANKILGDLDDLAAVVNQNDIRVLVIGERSLPRESALRLAVKAHRMGLRVLQAPFNWGVVTPRVGFVRLGGLEFVDLVGVEYPTVAEQAKRFFDLVAVLVGGAVLSPFFLLISLIIRLQDGGPVLYGSDRVGRGGRIFTFLKFRSMIVNADKHRDALPNEADGRLFKLKNDPRVTPFGRFIRKYSVDEFPQLINVLRGEMTLVGPRPLPARDLDGIDQDPEMLYWFEQRSNVNPGLTGLWQVSGRSNLGFADMVRLDIHYIQNWSFWLDIQILLKTLPAVLRGRGAS